MGRARHRGDALARTHEPLPTYVQGLPSLPASYDEALDAGLRDLGLATLEASARASIADHARLLLAWNEAINLTAIRTAPAIARDHVVDSLAALPLLRKAGVERLLDLGSGAGYPGIPLGIALHPDRTLLVESVGKKARFLATVARALGLESRMAVAATRSERLAADPHHRERWQAVLIRAVGSLADDVEIGLPLVEAGGLLVVWKSEPLESELSRAERAIEALGGRLAEVRGVTVAGLQGHCLVVIEKRVSSPAHYPRDPAARKRRPW